jgi:hypothetical protein
LVFWIKVEKFSGIFYTKWQVLSLDSELKIVMPSITFNFDDKLLSGDFQRKVSKEDLYGRVQKLVLKDGQALKKAYLLADGSAVPVSGLSNVKVDPDGTPIEDEILTVDGAEVSLQPSSFEEAANLEKAPLSSLAGFCCSDVYPINGLDLSAGLYRTWFSYRKSIDRKEALLLVKESQEAFLLVGHFKSSPLVGVSVIYSFFDSDDEGPDDEDDLDFSML